MTIHRAFAGTAVDIYVSKYNSECGTIGRLGEFDDTDIIAYAAYECGNIVGMAIVEPRKHLQCLNNHVKFISMFHMLKGFRAEIMLNDVIALDNSRDSNPMIVRSLGFDILGANRLWYHLGFRRIWSTDYLIHIGDIKVMGKWKHAVSKLKTYIYTIFKG